MLREAEVVSFLGGVDDAVGALLQRGFELLVVSLIPGCSTGVGYQGYCICWLGLQPMCQFFIVGNQMGDVDVAVILLHQHVLPYLVSGSDSSTVALAL